MKTGLTIQQMAQELLRQSKAKQDYLVNTGSLSLSVTSDAPQLRVTENGLDKIAPLDIRQTAHRQLGTYLGIPQKYYELMRTDAPELLAYNANYCNPDTCSECLYIGEGDSICEISHELVLDNWQSVPRTIPQECPFRRQIIRQRRKAVRRR